MLLISRTYRLTARLLPMLAVITLVCVGRVASAQTPAATTDSLSGKYEGVAKAEGTPATKFSLELKSEGSKVSGNVVAGDAKFDVSEGTLVDSKLTLKFVGHDGTFNGKVDGDKINGEFVGPQHKFVIELKKVAATTAAPATAATTTTGSSAEFSLTGDWDGVADADGQPFNFSLSLHSEGEKVTGTSTSQLGTSNVTNGTWKDGKLVFQLEGGNGTVSMNATVVEGKLTGEFDYAGQMQGKWVAVKKK